MSGPQEVYSLREGMGLAMWAREIHPDAGDEVFDQWEALPADEREVWRKRVDTVLDAMDTQFRFMPKNARRRA